MNSHAPIFRTDASASERLRLAIGIASTGRREILQAILPQIARQTRIPDEIVICVACPGDADEVWCRELGLAVNVVSASRGLCCQRNKILRNVPEADILLFLDDDFLMAPSYLEELEKLFQSNTDVVMSTGTVKLDGILGPGIPVSEGLRIVDTLPAIGIEADDVIPVSSAYGCNMAVRMSVLRNADLWFDENLPLYSWLEDVDFSGQIAPYGLIVRSNRLRGVHLGAKRGRMSGVRFGYSQIANPIYMVRKRTMSRRFAAAQLIRNLTANAVKVFRPEPWVDRKGRLIGNARALADLVRGRLAPTNITSIE